MKTLGIILAAGKSSRLYPSTLVTTKQLLPIYDKPLIYYPLSTLMLAGIRDVVIIVSPNEVSQFRKLFADSRETLGLNIKILVQDHPRGIADSFKIVYKQFGNNVQQYDTHALVLGDNIYYGAGFSGLLQNINPTHANVFLYKVKNPQDFGVLEYTKGVPTNIVEKPTHFTSDLAVTGLYFYPPSVYDYVDQIKSSPRGELEITDINRIYLDKQLLHPVKLPRGMVWFDTGSPDAMLEASNFVQTVQKHQGFMVGSPHEIAINNGWCDPEHIQHFVTLCHKTEYGKYLQQLLT